MRTRGRETARTAGRVRQAIEQEPCVVGEDADPSAGTVGLKMAQQARNALDEGLAADEPHVRIGAHLMGEVLAGTEADLEPEVADRRREEAVQLESRLLIVGQRDPKPRQGAVEQRLPARAEPVAESAPIDAAPAILHRAEGGAPAGRPLIPPQREAG